MSDLISRQDAIDAIELSMTAFVFDEMTIKEVLKEIADNTKEIAISRIKHLPSAEPKSSICKTCTNKDFCEETLRLYGLPNTRLDECVAYKNDIENML